MLRFIVCLGLSTGIHLVILLISFVPRSGVSVGAAPAATRLAVTLVPEHTIPTVPSPPVAGTSRPQQSDAGATEEDRESGRKSIERSLSVETKNPYFNSWEVEIRAVPVDLPELYVPEFILREMVVGKVTLHVLLSESGRVDRVEVLGSSHPGRLEEEAIRVLNATRFKPAMKGGVPVRSAKRVEVQFDPAELTHVQRLDAANPENPSK